MNRQLQKQINLAQAETRLIGVCSCSGAAQAHIDLLRPFIVRPPLTLHILICCTQLALERTIAFDVVFLTNFQHLHP
jgi:hypothetical protein